jgi:DNA-binding transcriptional MerR regulator
MYGEEDADRLSFIRHARDLGFELGSVRVLLALQKQPERPCSAASELASAQLAIVESRLKHLAILRDELQRMVRACGNGCVAECQVIDALAKMN